MINLPSHLINECIVPHLDSSGNFLLRRVCKRLKQAVDENPKWAQILRKTFGEESPTPFVAIIKKKVSLLTHCPSVIHTFQGFQKALIVRPYTAVIDKEQNCTLLTKEQKVVSTFHITPGYSVLHPEFIKNRREIVHIKTNEKLPYKYYAFIKNTLVIQNDKSLSIYEISPTLRKIHECKPSEWLETDEQLILVFNSKKNAQNIQIFDPIEKTFCAPKLKWPEQNPEIEIDTGWILESKGEELAYTYYITGFSVPWKPNYGISPVVFSSQHMYLEQKTEHFNYFDFKEMKYYTTTAQKPSQVRLIESLFYLIYETRITAYNPSEKRIFSLKTESEIEKITEVRWPFILIKTRESYQIFHLPRSKLLREFKRGTWLISGFDRMIYRPERRSPEIRSYPIPI